MEVQSHLESKRIELRFENEAEMREFVEAARSQGAFLLEFEELPAAFAEYTILLRLDPGFEAKLEASVVQLFADASPPSAAFQLPPLPRSWEHDFERRLRRATKPAEDRSEMTGVPPIVRIRQMNVRERMLLAGKADRIERAVLLRDSSAQVLLGPVTNPRVGTHDIVQLLRNPPVALVRNPKTPAPIAMRLVDGLPTEELRRLAKLQSGVREPLRKAALRAYLKRSRR
jgi:hypothetical protein